MGAKEMEGDNIQRRQRARDAREQGKVPAGEQVTLGASKQRETARRAKRNAGDAKTGKRRTG
ncbi:hypothetical protein Pflav_029300 [Phytohabitans flavus]|uniref:Uncharacterized protein n=2 Tax=Phytohabitans flavus TaxID=1076124 RepID=A0A6F8XRS4_9ACTN|nr:hypothetical protein Pflav_029300 [Phytohabitans flavus]